MLLLPDYYKAHDVNYQVHNQWGFDQWPPVLASFLLKIAKV